MKRLAVLLLALAGLGVVALATLVAYSAVELHRFRRAEVGRSTLSYAAPQLIRPGVDVRRLDLAGTLGRLRYRETRGTPAAPGEFRRVGSAWDIYLRRVDLGAPQPAQRVRLELSGDRIARVTRQGKPAGPLVLEPEVLTSGDDVPGEEMRPVRLDDVPLALRHAVLAAEDHRFLEHHGLDLRGLARALWTNLRAARVVQGGSTITQQLVKNRLLSRERTLDRKLREAWLAALVEWRYSKDEILEAYLNEIYLGHRGGLGVRGVGAAARTYYAKETHQLTLAEAALLAGMIRAPNRTSPVLDRARARERRDVVLGRMRDLGTITATEHDRARAEPVRARADAGTGQLAPYFTDHARREAEARIEGGLGARQAVHIVTTLDIALQRYAEAAVARGLERLEARRPALRAADPADRLQAAMIALDPRTGEIRAMVGGRDYRASQFNRAALAERQAGSAFKPLVYLTALRPHGQPGRALTAASFVDDAPIAIAVKDGPPWAPRNFEGRHEGRVTVRRALEASLNAATVRVAQAAGLPAVIDTARALGLRASLAAVPAVSLGAFEVTPLDLARAYLPLANTGRRFETAAVAAIHDTGGHALWTAEDTGTPVLSPAEAYLMTSLLEGVVRSGTAAGLVDLSVPVAGKTGTTNEGRDAWFIGYSSNLAALVWVGFDSGRAHGLSGAQAALPIWTDFMRQALATYPAAPFAVPEGVTLLDIDPTTGKIAADTCPIRVREVFLAGTEPPQCEGHESVAEERESVPELIRRRFWQPLLDWFRD
jgi:1A family penicillin-binding protein